MNGCKTYGPYLAGEGRYAEAYPVVEKALEIWPEDSELLGYCAYLEIAFKHNYTAGKDYMEKAFKFSTADSDLLYKLKGVLWWDYLDEKKVGLACLEKAVLLNPDVANLMNLASRVKSIDAVRAEGIYRDILRIEPEHLDAIGGLAELAFEKSDWRQGLELSAKAHALAPDDPSANAFLAYCQFNLGAFDEAMKCYFKAVEFGYFDEGYVYKGIAECYQKLGNPEEAIKYARKALSIDPDDSEAQKLVSDLADSGD